MVLPVRCRYLAQHRLREDRSSRNTNAHGLERCPGAAQVILQLLLIDRIPGAGDGKLDPQLTVQELPVILGVAAGWEIAAHIVQADPFQGVEARSNRGSRRYRCNGPRQRSALAASLWQLLIFALVPSRPIGRHWPAPSG